MTKHGKTIITLPNPHLREHSRKVGPISDEVKTIISNMQKATLDWEKDREHEVGVALAAVQIDELHRIVIVRNNPNDKNSDQFSVYINPVITKYEGPIQYDYEGCLSVPDIYGKVPRHLKVRVRATNIQGKLFRVSVDGFLARVFQHEVDHLSGKLFIDYIKGKKSSFYKLLPSGKLEQLDYEKDVKNNHILW